VQSDLFGRVPVIVIDVHETRHKGAASILIRMLEKRNYQYDVKPLPIGDYLLPKGVVIERKTVTDLINTLRGSEKGVPRLHAQLDSMLERYEYPIFVVEGGLRIRKDPIRKCIFLPLKRKSKDGVHYIVIEKKINISPRAYDALLESIRNRGVEVVETYNHAHTAVFILKKLEELLGKKKELTIWDEDVKRRAPVIRTKPKTMDLDEMQVFFLAGLPGINTARAKALLRVFRTPMNALNNVEKWKALRGFGDKLVRDVKKVLYTEWVEKEE